MMVIMVSVKSMIKNIVEYLHYSDISFTINLNPVRWGFNFEYIPPDDYNPSAYTVLARVLMIKLTILIDDGSW